MEIKEDDYTFRNTHRMCQPKKRTTTYRLRSFAYTGATLWNNLQVSETTEKTEKTDLSIFKSYVKDLHISLDPKFSYA